MQNAIQNEDGRNATSDVSLPAVDSGWSLAGNSYVYMDLEVDVPADIALDVRDSSGDVKIEGTGAEQK